MSALFILIGISILVAAGFLTAFLWSVKNGQYDDDYTPSIRILFDNELTAHPNKVPSGRNHKNQPSVPSSSYQNKSKTT